MHHSHGTPRFVVPFRVPTLEQPFWCRAAVSAWHTGGGRGRYAAGRRTENGARGWQCPLACGLWREGGGGRKRHPIHVGSPGLAGLQRRVFGAVLAPSAAGVHGCRSLKIIGEGWQRISERWEGTGKQVCRQSKVSYDLMPPLTLPIC